MSLMGAKQFNLAAFFAFTILRLPGRLALWKHLCELQLDYDSKEYNRVRTQNRLHNQLQYYPQSVVNTSVSRYQRESQDMLKRKVGVMRSR